MSVALLFAFACGPSDRPRGKLVHAEVPLSAEGLDSTVDFGATQSPQRRTITYVNEGDGTVEITDLSFVDGELVAYTADGRDRTFGFGWLGRVQISPGARFSFDTSFNPSVPVDRVAQARLQLTVENAQADTAMVTLAGHRLDGACVPFILGLQFGSVTVGTELTEAIDLPHPLSEPGHYVASKLSVFDFDGQPVSDGPLTTVEPLPATVDIVPFGKGHFPIRFAPKTKGSWIAKLEIDRRPFCDPVEVEIMGFGI